MTTTSTPHDTPTVRLTRRGRLVLVLGVLVVALVAFTAGRGSSA